jgi:hypothetical protein
MVLSALTSGEAVHRLAEVSASRRLRGVRDDRRPGYLGGDPRRASIEVARRSADIRARRPQRELLAVATSVTRARLRWATARSFANYRSDDQLSIEYRTALHQSRRRIDNTKLSRLLHAEIRYSPHVLFSPFLPYAWDDNAQTASSAADGNARLGRRVNPTGSVR